MHTSLVRNLALLLSTVVLITACKKNKEEELPVSQTTIAGAYTLGSYVTTSLLGEKDKLSEMDACKRDDLYVLNQDYSFQYQDAGASCSSAGLHAPVWVLAGDYITIDGKVYKIEKLSNQQLIVTFDESVLNILYTSRLIFNRK
jgi:hypothetical protein